MEHDDRWKDHFNEIEKMLTGLLADRPVVRISHIGSTAKPDIWAKNIVDVMVEISQSIDVKDMHGSWNRMASRRSILARIRFVLREAAEMKDPPSRDGGQCD